MADEVHVHFPWGSLLRAMATGDQEVLQNLRRICSPGALLEVVVGLDPDQDSSEMERLGLQPVSLSYIDDILIPRFSQSFATYLAGAERYPKPCLIVSHVVWRARQEELSSVRWGLASSA